MKLRFLPVEQDIEVCPINDEKLGGTNGAKLYEDSTGAKYVIKFYQEPEDSYNEVLTNKLYELAKVNVPFASLVFDQDNNRYGVASTYIESFKTANEKSLTKEQEKELRIDSVIHAWLNNWDFVGPHYDNIGTCAINEDGRTLLSIDHRCGLNGRGLPRAGEGRTKTEHYGIEAFDPVVRSLTSLQDPKKNKQTAEFLSNLSDDEIKQGVKRIAEIPEDDIRKIVNKHTFGEDENKKTLLNTILLRRKYLMMKYFVFNNEISKNTEFEEIANLTVNAFYREEADGDNSFRQIYKEKKAEELLDNKCIEPIKRLKHGGMHVSRVAYLVRVFFELYKKYDKRTDLLTEEMIKMLMIAAMFHDAGREKDSGKDRKEWEKKSYELARTCLIALGYEERLATIVASSIFYAEKNDISSAENIAAIFASHISGITLTDEEKPILILLAQILHDADSMDYHRFSYTPFDINQLNFHTLHATKRESATRLLYRVITEHNTILKETGDLLGGSEFDIYEKAEYEHSDQCYTNIANKMCENEFFAEHYNQFVSFQIVSESQVPCDAENVIKATTNNFIAISLDSDKEPSSYQDAVYEYKYLENNLDQKQYQVITARYGLRIDDRSPDEIIAAGGFNPRKTLIVEKNSEAVISDVLVVLMDEIKIILKSTHLNRRKDGRPARNVDELQQASERFQKYLRIEENGSLQEATLPNVLSIIKEISNIAFGKDHPLQSSCNEASRRLDELQKWYENNKRAYKDTLSVDSHREKAHENTGFVSFSVSSHFFDYESSYRYLAKIPYSIIHNPSVGSSYLYKDEYELSVPGGVEWRNVIASLDGKNKLIFIRKDFLTRRPELLKNILQAFLEKDQVVILKEHDHNDNNLMSKMIQIAQTKGIDTRKISLLLAYHPWIQSILKDAADDKQLERLAENINVIVVAYLSNNNILPEINIPLCRAYLAGSIDNEVIRNNTRTAADVELLHYYLKDPEHSTEFGAKDIDVLALAFIAACISANIAYDFIQDILRNHNFYFKDQKAVDAFTVFIASCSRVKISGYGIQVILENTNFHFDNLEAINALIASINAHFEAKIAKSWIRTILENPNFPFNKPEAINELINAFCEAKIANSWIQSILANPNFPFNNPGAINAVIAFINACRDNKIDDFYMQSILANPNFPFNNPGAINAVIVFINACREAMTNDLYIQSILANPNLPFNNPEAINVLIVFIKACCAVKISNMNIQYILTSTNFPVDNPKAINALIDFIYACKSKDMSLGAIISFLESIPTGDNISDIISKAIVHVSSADMNSIYKKIFFEAYSCTVNDAREFWCACRKDVSPQQNFGSNFFRDGHGNEKSGNGDELPIPPQIRC